jgi:hypothetical protein
MKWLCAGLAMGSVLAASSCAPRLNFPVHEESISRTISPDRRMEAVLFFRDAGAMTSTVYFLKVHQTGVKPDSVPVALTIRHAGSIKSDLTVRWLSDRQVQVNIPKGDAYMGAKVPHPAGFPIVITVHTRP